MTDKERQMRREKMVDILSIAKANGCDVYITPEGKPVAHGAIVFPDKVILGVYEGVFVGWDFAIIYKYTKKNGNGRRCTKESTTTVTWEIIKSMKGKGIERAKEINAEFYAKVNEWKRKPHNKELIKL